MKVRILQVWVYSSLELGFQKGTKVAFASCVIIWSLVWTSLSLSAEQVRFRSQYPLKIILSFEPIAAPKFSSSPLKTYQPQERIIFQTPFFTGYFTCQTKSLRFLRWSRRILIQPSTVALKRRSWNIIFNRVGLLRFCPGITYHDLQKKTNSFRVPTKNGGKMFAWKMAPKKHKYIKSRNIIYISYINIFKETWGPFFI